MALRHLPAASRDKSVDPYTHHVRTDNTAFLTDIGYSALKGLFDEGRNCRYLTRPSQLAIRPDDMWTAWIEALKTYTSCHSTAICEADKAWITDHLTSQALHRKHWAIPCTMTLYKKVYTAAHGGMSQPSLIRALDSIHKAYTITVCDKTVERSVIECKLHYRLMVSPGCLARRCLWWPRARTIYRVSSTRQRQACMPSSENKSCRPTILCHILALSQDHQDHHSG